VKKRILLMEDDLLISKFLEHVAAGAGYDVTVTGSGCRVLYHLRRERYDMVITDIAMPRVDGIKAIQLLRGRRSMFPDIPVLALSADWGVEAKVMAVGADVFLAKPVENDVLLQTIARLLGNGAPKPAPPGLA
jgi:CheY-like chemotaxis protein